MPAISYRKRHKYGAIATEVDGIRFDSRKEARRFSELRLLEKAGEINDLKCQPMFWLYAPVLKLNDVRVGKPIGYYRADFAYWDRGQYVVEDVKSPATLTPLSKWKIKHCELQYGITVKLT